FVLRSKPAASPGGPDLVAVAPETSRATQPPDTGPGKTPNTGPAKTPETRKKPPDPLPIVGGTDLITSVASKDLEQEELCRLVSRDRSLAVAFSPDGQRLLVGSFSRRLALYDLAKGQVIRNYSAPNLAVRQLAFLPDGRRFLLADYENGVQVCDL